MELSVKDFYDYPDESMQFLQRVIGECFSSHQSGDVSGIEAILEELDPSKTALLHSCGFLRTNFRFNGKLKNWFKCRDRVKQFVLDNAFDMDVLCGLLSDENYKPYFHGLDSLLNVHPSLRT